MTARDPSAAWWFVEIRPSVDADGLAAVTFRQSVEGPTYHMSPDQAEDAAWRLLEAAKLARAGIDRDDPGTAR